MINQTRIEYVKRLIEKLSNEKFFGEVRIQFQFGGISSVVKTEKLQLEETKI